MISSRYWLSLLQDIEQGGPLQHTDLVLVITSNLLKAFYDESGNHRGARYFVLAGFIASPRRWSQFEVDWKNALALARPALSDFHAADFFPSRHKRLSSSRKRCLEGLARAVIDNNLTPSGGIADLAAFEALSYGERKYLSGAMIGAGDGVPPPRLSKPYYLLFHHCLAHAVSLTKPGKVVQVFFERQEEYRAQALGLYDVIKDKLPADVSGRLGVPSFPARDQSGPPLECADLLAYCWYARMQYGPDNSADREEALTLLMSKVGEIHKFDAKDYEILLAHDLTSEKRAAMQAETEP